MIIVNSLKQHVIPWLYAPIVWWVRNFGDEKATRFWEHRGYRACVGGRWGRWDMGVGMMRVMMWWPSPCDHYPPPILANHTEPIEVEEYSSSDREGS